MSVLSSRDKELVALGAALGSNCVPCVEYHIPEARKAGLNDEQIVEAMHLADRVRQVPAKKVLEVGLQMLGQLPVDSGGAKAHPCRSVSMPAPSATGCGCK